MATKTIKFDLQINGKRISTFEELQDNFSAHVLPIFQSGRLYKWLLSREMPAQADAVKAIDTNDSELEQLTAICQILELDSDAEVLGFMLEDWKAERMVAEKAATNSVATEAAAGVAEEDLAAETTGTGVDWSGKDMTGKNFVGEDLRNGKFVGTNFTSCNLTNADFSGADLSSAIFKWTEFSGCKFDNSILKEANFTNIRSRGTPPSFNKSDLSKTKFFDVFFYSGATFIKSNLSNSEISNSGFIECVFVEAKIIESVFSNVFLCGSNFQDCDLSFSSFMYLDEKEKYFNIILEAPSYVTGDFHGNFNSFLDWWTKKGGPAVNFNKAKLTGISGLPRSIIDAQTEAFLKSKLSEAKK